MAERVFSSSINQKGQNAQKKNIHEKDTKESCGHHGGASEIVLGIYKDQRKNW